MTDVVDRLPLALAFAADHLWQSTLFAGAVWIAVACAGRASARARYALWVVALAKFAVPSALVAAAVVRLAPGLFSASARAVEGTTARAVTAAIAEPISTAAARGAHASLISIAAATLFAVWLAGAIAFLARWAASRRRFASVVAAGDRLTAGREADAVERARRRLGVDRMTDVVTSAEVVEPGVWGDVRSVVVLPEGLAERLSDEELDMLATHELVHVARRDNLVANLLHALCCCVWFHPLVWLLELHTRAERESVCDELVLSLESQANAYASTLVTVSRFCVESDGLVGRHAMAGPDLRRRIERIMSGEAQRQSTLRERLAVSSVLGLLIVVAVALGGSGALSALAKERAAGDRSLAAAAAAADLLPLVRESSAKSIVGGQNGAWIVVSAASKRYDASTGIIAFTLTASDPSILEGFSEKNFEIVPAIVTGGMSTRPIESAAMIGQAKGTSSNDLSMAIKLPAEANAVMLRMKFGPDDREGGFNLVIDAGDEPQPATVSMGVPPEAP